MMAYMGSQLVDIDRMPRGGPDASCLDRRLETDRLEYLDRDDVDERVKRSVIRALEWAGELFGNHEKFAHIALDEVADVPDPKILELGAGHGGLSRKLLEMHPTARLTVTDIERASVGAIAAGDLGQHPRVSVREMDATAIDTCMQLGAGHPMGPLALLDLVGLDVSAAIGRTINVEIPAKIEALIAEGALGKKVGRGFYAY